MMCYSILIYFMLDLYGAKWVNTHTHIYIYIYNICMCSRISNWFFGFKTPTSNRHITDRACRKSIHLNPLKTTFI